MPSSSSTNTDALTPRHPAAPEAHVRLAVIGAYLNLRSHIAAVLRQHAPMVRSLRLDSALTTDIRAALMDHGRHLARASQPRIRHAAASTADVVREQTAAAVAGEVDVDLTPEVDAYALAVIDRMDQDFDDTIECSMVKLEEWAADGELDEEALELMLDDCDRSGSLTAWLALMFGWTFAQMTRRAQIAAGVEEAEWVAKQDERTRSAHYALHGTVFRWNGAPPLKAEKATNGEDCWPGDDYNCRCVPRVVLTLGDQ